MSSDALALESSVLGIIGGSGLYQMTGAKKIAEHFPKTPYGTPSAPIVEISMEQSERKIYFLPRHGIGHHLTPSEVPYRANVFAMKELGVTHLAAISAVGIMTEIIQPGELVIPDQIFDFTKGIRPSTFFGDGLVGHIPFANPFCGEFSSHLDKAAKSSGASVHRGGTYLCIEGPRFNTRAEAQFFRQTLKPAIIGMTACPEAILAREAEISYGLIGLATDYDCWREDVNEVSAAQVLAVFHANLALAQRLIVELSAQLPKKLNRPFAKSSQNAWVTDLQRIPSYAKNRNQFSSYFH